jgi:hypothetical protein
MGASQYRPGLQPGGRPEGLLTFVENFVGHFVENWPALQGGSLQGSQQSRGRRLYSEPLSSVSVPQSHLPSAPVWLISPSYENENENTS